VFRIRQGIRLPIWPAKRLPYSCAVKAIRLLLVTCAATLHAQDVHVAVPPAGKLYHGLYWGGVGTDEHDPTEHDVTPNDVARYEQAVGIQAAWIYFANNWFESRKFPAETCNWIRDLRKIPYVRLMLRSDVDQRHREKKFTLQKIVAGEFDAIAPPAEIEAIHQTWRGSELLRVRQGHFGYRMMRETIARLRERGDL